MALGWVLTVVCVQGCISIHTEKEGPAAYEPKDTTIHEIDAVSKLSFDNDRQVAYKRIAQRAGLSDTAQVHLVEAVFRRLSFEEAKVDVLLTLVKNSSFSPAAEAAILDRLSHLSFENDRSRVLDAISKRKG